MRIGGGVSAAAQMTSANAASRSARPSGSSGSGSPNTIGPAAIVSTFAVVRGEGDHRHDRPELERAGGDEQPDERQDQDHERERVDDDREPEASVFPLSALIVMSEPAHSSPAEIASASPLLPRAATSPTPAAVARPT